jgi:gliding motility-associated-like protein
MRINRFFLTALAVFLPVWCQAQSGYPSVSPTATYLNDEGVETESTDNIEGQAPLTVTFRANPSDIVGHNPSYEWHFRMEGEATDMAVRYEEDTEYTFTMAGVVRVTLIFKPDASQEAVDSTMFSVTIKQSTLIFPNAFSPHNGDEINDVFKAKEYQSIVEFHAYIFNRWGQKLYDWTDPAGGWDGTYNGKDVKEGVYFLLVKAKGADGIEYNIKKDVNLLRGYTETTGDY